MHMRMHMHMSCTCDMHMHMHMSHVATERPTPRGPRVSNLEAGTIIVVTCV